MNSDYFLKENGEVFHTYHTDRKQAYAHVCGEIMP